MTVKEFIEDLKNFDENMEVAVQFRDDGGDYKGTDDEIRLYVNNDKLIL